MFIIAFFIGLYSDSRRELDKSLDKKKSQRWFLKRKVKFEGKRPVACKSGRAFYTKNGKGNAGEQKRFRQNFAGSLMSWAE